MGTNKANQKNVLFLLDTIFIVKQYSIASSIENKWYTYSTIKFIFKLFKKMHLFDKNTFICQRKKKLQERSYSFIRDTVYHTVYFQY